MLTMNITLKKSNMDKLEKRLKALAKMKTKVGYFQEQGEHYSGMTYPELVALHSSGVPSKNIPARPIFEIAYMSYDVNKSTIKKDLTKYLSKIGRSTSPIKVTTIGKNFVNSFSQHMLPIFGDTSKLKSNSPYTQHLKTQAGVEPNNPLVWTGDLRDNLSYKLNNKLAKA